MSHILDIIIPTYNNYEFLAPCVQSINSNQSAHGLFQITVINNGHKNSCDFIPKEAATVINSDKNLGWEGALKLGLENTTAPFVLFLNDDTYIPTSSQMWLNSMLKHFQNPKVGAVGCSSNVVMGLQNIFNQTRFHCFEVKFLIGFCFMVRRKAIMEAGGIDDTLPGGDDLDMSIRLRQKEYMLVCDKDVFVYHHGFKTGSKLYGNEQKKNGWNSFEMLEKTNTALIKKHGFSEWWDCMKGAWEQPKFEYGEIELDTEGKEIRKHICPGFVLDLGCGANKTIPEAIGMDMVPENEKIISLTGNPESSADVVGDVSEPLPFEENSVDTVIARHILEHLMDSTQTIKQWVRVLKPGGRLIIAVPDNGKILSIPMNFEHVHAWNPPAMKNMLEAIGGVRVVEQIDPKNGISFITVAEKI